MGSSLSIPSVTSAMTLKQSESLLCEDTGSHENMERRTFPSTEKRQFNGEDVLEPFPTHFCIAPITRNEISHKIRRRIFPQNEHAVNCFFEGPLSSLGLAASGFSTPSLKSTTSCVLGEISLTTGSWTLEVASSATSPGIASATVVIVHIIVESHIAAAVSIGTRSTFFNAANFPAGVS